MGSKVPTRMEFIRFMTTAETLSQPTVIWDLSLVLHGHWSCPGVEKIAVFLHLEEPHFRSMPQKTRILRTGIVTAYVWSEWDLCRLTPPIGEQHAAIRPTASILETTSVETSDFNIIDFLGSGTCKRVEYINIRGYNGTNLTAPFWQQLNIYTLHIDCHSRYTKCEFNAARTGAVSSEDNFGYYGSFNTNFRCTQGTQSTTQWWFGALV